MCPFEGQVHHVKKHTPLGPYYRRVPRALWWSQGAWRFLMSEVPLYRDFSKVRSNIRWEPAVGDTYAPRTHQKRHGQSFLLYETKPPPLRHKATHPSRGLILSCSAVLAQYLFFLFFTVVTVPRRSLSLKLSDARVYTSPPRYHSTIL